MDAALLLRLAKSGEENGGPGLRGISGGSGRERWAHVHTTGKSMVLMKRRRSKAVLIVL